MINSDNRNTNKTNKTNNKAKRKRYPNEQAREAALAMNRHKVQIGVKAGKHRIDRVVLVLQKKRHTHNPQGIRNTESK